MYFGRSLMENSLTLDTFMLCLNISDYYPDSDLIFWLEYFEEKSNGKIYIISFRKIKNEIVEKFSQEKFVWVEQIAQTFEDIENYVDKISPKDIVIVVGGERLVDGKIDGTIASVQVGNKTSNLYLQENENWVKFSIEIDKLYTNLQSKIQGIVFICNVNNTIADIIKHELENSHSMSIGITETAGNNVETRVSFKLIMKQINGKSLEDAFKIISDHKEELTELEVIICNALANYNNGSISKSIVLLREKYEELSLEQKQFLADLYIMKEEYESAQEIFEEIYMEDKQQSRLYDIGLGAYPEESLRYKELLLEGIKYQPRNLTIVEKYGDWLTANGQFGEAAKYFRQINSPYYELVALVNDLLEEGQTDLKIVRAYIFKIVDEYPELKNEAVIRIALFALKENRYYNAYEILKEANLNEINEVTKSIIQKKIEILKDTTKASRALRKLKPYAKERDRETLLDERCEVLLQSMHLFSYYPNEFQRWRELLSCQQMDAWNFPLSKYVSDTIKELSVVDFDLGKKQSYVMKIDSKKQEVDADKAILFLREYNASGISSESFNTSKEEILKNCCIVGEATGNVLQKMWIRYYCSISASILNDNPQDANNFALGISEYIRSLENENDRELGSALFLMAWGNSQYRLGNHVEGIACIIASIKKLIKTGEIVPVVEEGGNILAKYLVEIESLFSPKVKIAIAAWIEPMAQNNESLQCVVKSFTNNLEKMIEELEVKVENEEKNIHWVIDLANLVSSLCKCKREDSAIEYIKKYYLEAEKLIDRRQDIVARLFRSWGDTLIKTQSSVENIMLGLEFFDKAITQMKKRRRVYHQEERAALAEEYDELLRDYLCYSGLVFSATDTPKEIKEKLKEEICKKMSICLPLSVIEQKNYYKNKVITEEVACKSEKLQLLKMEYSAMIKENKGTNEEVNSLAAEIEKLTNELVVSHPYYKPLEEYKGSNWEEIQRNLSEDEVVYQYVLTQMTVVSIIVTKDWIDVQAKFIDISYNTPIEAMEQYGYIVEHSTVGIENIDTYSEMISGLVAEHLCQYVFYHEIKNVYVIPDVAKSYFPFSAIKYKNEYLIDKVDDIINFIDYSQLLHLKRKLPDNLKIANRLFGKPSDKSINYIKKWLQQHETEQFIDLSNSSDDLNSLNKLKEDSIATIAIYGHGVRDISATPNEGAQVIEGLTSMIEVKDILENISADNLILISCVTGIPNSINPELSSGTWKSMFERFNGNIISCKWSVPTEDTMELLEYLFEFLQEDKIPISQALVLSQRKMKEQGKGQLSWAGIECWIN